MYRGHHEISTRRRADGALLRLRRRQHARDSTGRRSRASVGTHSIVQFQQREYIIINKLLYLGVILYLLIVVGIVYELIGQQQR